MSKIEEFKKHFYFDRSSMVNKFRFLILAQVSLTVFIVLEVVLHPEYVAAF